MYQDEVASVGSDTGNAGNGSKPRKRDRRPRLRDSRLYYRPESAVIWCHVVGANGRKERKSTKCRDPLAASAKADEFERRAANPLLHAAESVTLREAVDDYLANQRMKGIKEATLSKVEKDKFGWFFTTWGVNFPLNQITGSMVLEYISWRKKECASGRSDGSMVGDYTIKRDVQYLSYMLRHALFTGKFHTPLEKVIPADLPGSAARRKRHPSIEQTWALMDGLVPERRAHIAALAAGLMRLGESRRMRRSDINLAEQKVLIRGSKTAGSWGEIPMTPITLPFWQYVLDHAPGKGPEALLFLPWSGATRQLGRVCKRLGYEKFSCHDFRRASATWHRRAGMSPTGIALLLRHVNDKLAQEVYADVRDAETIREQYVSQLREDHVARGLVKTVPAVYETGQSNEVQPDELRTDSPGKEADQGNGASLVTAVHGSRTVACDDGVIAAESPAAETATVLAVYTPRAKTSERPFGEVPPAEKGSTSRPAEAPEEPGTNSLADALGLLLRTVAGTANAEAQAALTHALTLMAAPRKESVG